MKPATLKQGQHLLNLVAHSEIERRELQLLLQSGDFTDLLRKYQKMCPPTIKPITVPIDYSRTLANMVEAGHFGSVCLHFNDKNFPVEVRESGLRKLVLVCFHWDIHDDEDPAKSELLQELDKLGLQPEGPPELCAAGEYRPEIECIARRQTWRDYDCKLVCPMTYATNGKRQLELGTCNHGRALRWHKDCQFLASRKPNSK